MRVPLDSSVVLSEDLSYLDDLVDFEGGVDRGPLSGKQYLVYSPGKTGTVSIYESIVDKLSEQVGYREAVNKMLHNHNNASIVSVLKDFGKFEKKELLAKNIVRDLIEYKYRKGERISIITSFRDPLKRAISGTFQQLENLVVRGELSMDSICYDEIYKKLMVNLNGFLVAKHPLEEICEKFFDLYSFDHTNGHCRVSFDSFDVLALCLEKSESWESSLRDFTGFKDLVLKKSNTVSEKKVSLLHDEFVSQLKLENKKLLNLYYGNERQHRHISWFYTESEIEKMFHDAVLQFGTD